jgi:hypothetical protein
VQDLKRKREPYVDLSQVKDRLTEIELELDDAVMVRFHIFHRNGRPLSVYLTKRLKRQCSKGRVWKSKPMLTALKNAEYGFDPDLSRSAGGRDGLFLLDRSWKPKNEMMKKIFDRYMDREDEELKIISDLFGVGVSELKGARLVSHDLRLLGVLVHRDKEDDLVLVDYDDTKE